MADKPASYLALKAPLFRLLVLPLMFQEMIFSNYYGEAPILTMKQHPHHEVAPLPQRSTPYPQMRRRLFCQTKQNTSEKAVGSLQSYSQGFVYV